MDIRNIQKTGNMFYVYLPTSWCKKFNINSDSKVSLSQDSKGALCVSPRLTEKKQKHLEFNIEETDLEVINKLVVSCYLNPLASFKINLSKKMDYTQLLNQKQLISLGLVEFSKDSITCDSSISISDPLALLTTMTRKIRNLIVIMAKDPNKALIDRYEEEIDRTNILIEKSVLSAFSNIHQTPIKTIDLHFISLVSRNLERMIDWLIISNADVKFLEILERSLEKLSEIIEDIPKKSVSIDKAIDLIKQIEKLNSKQGEKDQIRHNMTRVSEVITDWIISKQSEN